MNNSSPNIEKSETQKQNDFVPPLKAFVCYAREDLDVVLHTLRELVRKDIEFLQDLNDILPSEPWAERVRSLISQSDLLLYFASSSSVTSDACEEELEYAASLGKRIFPIALERSLDDQMPKIVSGIQWFFADGDGALDIDALHTAIATNADWIREHTRYLVAAQDWLASGRRARRLLRGRDVDSAKKWVTKQPPKAPEVLPLHAQFIRASRNLRRIIRTSMVGVTALSIAGAFVLYQISLDNRRSYSDILARDAATMLDNGMAPVEIVRTAIASWLLDPDKFNEGMPRSQSVEVMAEAFSHQRLRSILEASQLPNGLGDHAFSSRLIPGGRYLVVQWQDQQSVAPTFPVIVEDDQGAETDLVPVPAETFPDPGDITWQARIVDLGKELAIPEAPIVSDPLAGFEDAVGFLGPVVVSGDGSTLIWTMKDGGVFVYRPATGEALNLMAAGNASGSITALDNDGQRAIAQTEDGPVIRDLIGNVDAPIRPSKPDEGQVVSVSLTGFSPDGKFLAGTVHYDIGGPAASRACVFDASSGEEVTCSLLDPSFAGGTPFYNETIGPMAFSPDSLQLSYTDWGNSLRTLDIESGTVQVVETGAGGFIRDLVYFPNGRYIAVSSGHNNMVGGLDHSLVIFDSVGRAFYRSGRVGEIGEIGISSDGRVLTAEGGGGFVTRWDVGFGAMREQLALTGRLDSGLSVISGGYSPRFGDTFVLHGDRSTFAPDSWDFINPFYPGYERHFVVYDLPSGRELRRLSVPKSTMLGASVADEQDLLAVIVRGTDRVQLYRYSSFEALSEIVDIPSGPTDVHIARQAEVIAVGNRAGEIMVIDGDRRLDFRVEGEVARVVLSPDARYLAALFGQDDDSSSKLVRVWDVERPDEPILNLFGVFALSRSAFAAELPRFTVAVSRGAAVYDLRGGLLYSRLSSARGLSILEAGISNSGFHVVTREDTGPVLLHDVETEEPVFVVGGHGYGTGSIEFDSLGLTLTTIASSYDVLRHWNVGLSDYNLFRHACRSLPERHRKATLDMVEARLTAGVFSPPKVDCESLELPGPRR